MNNTELNIFTDGGSRGNPGPSACAFVIKDHLNNIVYQQGNFLGTGTNNNAEYYGVYYAYQYLESVSDKPETLRFFLDSELVVKQLSGIYKIKDQNLQQVAGKIKYLQQPYSVTYSHIPRSKNSAADLLVNQTLDSQ